MKPPIVYRSIWELDEKTIIITEKYTEEAKIRKRFNVTLVLLNGTI